MTKIGDDGRATTERHGTDHFSSGSHTDLHDHPVDWTGGSPHLGPPINHLGVVPGFKCYGGKRVWIHIFVPPRQGKTDLKQSVISNGV